MDVLKNFLFPKIDFKSGQYKTRTADCGLSIKHGLGKKGGLRTMYIKTNSLRKVKMGETESGLA